MIRRLLGVFAPNQQVEDAADNAAEPLHIDVDEEIVEGGWLTFTRSKRSSDGFTHVERPTIVAMDDVEDQDVAASPRVAKPEAEAIRRREQLNKARAKTASRKHLESVMFADPVSGKDVRFVKPSSGSMARFGGSTSSAVRRLNAQSGTQRSKKTSGKSNDRKVHRATDIFVFPEVV